MTTRGGERLCRLAEVQISKYKLKTFKDKDKNTIGDGGSTKGHHGNRLYGFMGLRSKMCDWTGLDTP